MCDRPIPESTGRNHKAALPLSGQALYERHCKCHVVVSAVDFPELAVPRSDGSLPADIRFKSLPDAVAKMRQFHIDEKRIENYW